MLNKPWPIRFGEDLESQVRSYADANAGGNFCKAVRTLVLIGLERDKGLAQTEDLLEVKFHELEDRITRTVSRGTKASLACLALSSIEMASAESPVSVSVDSASEVFDYAWRAGGKLQVTGIKPDLVEGLKNSRLPKAFSADDREDLQW